MEYKYIVYKKEGENLFRHIVFDKITNHSDFRSIGKIFGAGFCRMVAKTLYENFGGGESAIDHIEFKCYGESTSLNIKSRGIEDAAVLVRIERKLYENRL